MIASPYEDRVKEVLNANTAWELAELYVVISDENIKLQTEWHALIAENQATLADSAQAIKTIIQDHDETKVSLALAVEEIGALTVAQANLMRERDEARAAQALAEEKYAKLAEVAGGENLAEQIRRATIQREMDGLRKSLDEARAWAEREKLIEPAESAWDILARVGEAALVRYGTKP
ncbi:hypothetical protein HOU02_gp112 [Caulobacter phage CcrBL9]|uniref:Uncharacterized protein n=1 Tax=Caulobacter phage CcrBL9 TaxID=2283270 RepID=A0A385EBR1_9CAUD|nr:hypothetical protein HOU02_gp112 [Caulobacter phage CcrBL9]AXQ69136.1 hypothetical protein CcrBL9_gp112 [Caulobacter phage CcrBL9]